MHDHGIKSYVLSCLLIGQLIPFISSTPNFGNELSPRIDHRFKIPSNIIGEDKVPKTDIPGEPLDPNDFMRGEKEIQPDHAPDYDVEDAIFIAGKFQGDIIIPNANVANNLENNVVVSDQPLNNAIVQEQGKWINAVIPYTISASYSSIERGTIASALASFHQKTCIRFVPRASENDYIFIRKGSGCSSAVGRTTGEQQVSLGTGCLTKGIVIHELMHAVGFWHEHSRADRDSNISIMWSNIIKGMEFNFHKYEWSMIQSLGTPYDVFSVMHYGPHAFAIDRQRPTIVPRDPKDSSSMGQRNGLSKNDILKINLLYKCTKYLKGGGGGGGSVGATTTYKPPVVITTTQAPFCSDGNVHCDFWASIGECSKNSIWMKSNCKKSCSNCGVQACEDDNSNCDSWKNAGHCQKSASYMNKHCKKSCGICGGKGTTSQKQCQDDNQYCDSWAKSGECRANPSYMLKNCKKSCNICF